MQSPNDIKLPHFIWQKAKNHKDKTEITYLNSSLNNNNAESWHFYNAWDLQYTTHLKIYICLDASKSLPETFLVKNGFG